MCILFLFSAKYFEFWVEEIDKSDTNYLIMEILSCILLPTQTSENWFEG